MTTHSQPSTLPPPSGADVPIAIQGVITDPKLVGYQLVTNYECLYWRALVGNEPWSLYEVLRSFCHDGHNTCHPSINFLMSILGIKERRLLTGRTTTINGIEYHYSGLIDILQEHHLLIVEVEGDGPTLRYRFHVVLTPPLLREDQLARLPDLLQRKHAALLTRCEQEAKRLQAKQKPPKVRKPTKALQPEGSGNLPEGSGNLPEGSGNLPDKQHPSNTTHRIDSHTRVDNNNNGDNLDAVVALLTGQGISAKVAQRLTHRYSRARIEEKIAYLEFLHAEAPEKVQSPRGWLRRAIEEDYGPPDGFLPKAERERRDAEAAQQGQEEEERARASETASRAFQAQIKAQQAAARQALHDQYGTTQQEIDLWQQVVEELRMQLGEATFHAYVSNTLLLSLRDGQALIGLANPMAKDWVENRLGKRIQNLLTRQLTGRRVTMQFVTLEGPATPPAEYTEAPGDHRENVPVAAAA